MKRANLRAAATAALPIAIASVFVSACGGNPPPAQSPAPSTAPAELVQKAQAQQPSPQQAGMPPAGEQVPAETDSTSRAYPRAEAATAPPGTQPTALAPPPAPAARDSSGPAPKTRARASLSRARGDLDVALRQLGGGAGAGACGSACRALASMERATAHLCELATTDDDRRACDDARVIVRTARTKVKSSCGSCPGGPSVEASAPIPSMAPSP